MQLLGEARLAGVLASYVGATKQTDDMVDMGEVTGWLHDVPWGDAATWMTAVVTGAALWFARTAVKRSGELLEVEQKRDEKRDEWDREQRHAAERAEQADFVAAWHDRAEVPTRMQAIYLPSYGARIINHSPLPIWDVTVEFIGPDGAVRGAKIIPVVPPGQHFEPWPDELRRQEPASDGGDPVIVEALNEFTVTLAFRDVAGRRWRRDEYGYLTFQGRVSFTKLDATLRRNITTHSAGLE